MSRIKRLYVRFRNKLRNDEIEFFRGAVLSKMQDASVLFHNHIGDNFRYSYPLIQYKRLSGKATIVCLEEGTEAIGQFFSAGDFCFQIGTRDVKMEIASVQAKQVLVQLWHTEFTYWMTRWLPFNEENYRSYKQMEGLGERFLFLEKTLIGNILSFAKGLRIYFENEVVCKILEVENPYWVWYKGVRMMAFNVRFKTNVSLPDGIGLGIGASLGNGVLTSFVVKKG